MIRHLVSNLAAILTCIGSLSAAESVTVYEPYHHFRIEGPREWEEFADKPHGERLETKFSSTANEGEWTLRLRHTDLKQAWRVSLNGKPIATLARDENDMVVYLAVPAGAVNDGENTLIVEQTSQNTPDDVRLGEITLFREPRGQLLGQAKIEIAVVDSETNEPLPARLTIVDAQGSLHETSAESSDRLAVRTGTIYTAGGVAEFGLPAGKYTLFAGRGFEYSLASVDISVKPGETAKRKLTIRREVPTDGYIACDTHVHTLTHSGHGDSTVQERMITLAAEGIELPIATDHNVHIDHEPFAREMNVRQYFTPVIGNEVTTPTAHFNIFPVAKGAAIPDFKQEEWAKTLDSIYATPGVKVAILNHARDIHRGVRPHDPRYFNAAVGENLDGWAMRFNAMEVVNSSASQSDVMRLFHDWMALLNRGRRVTPVGSSDSHDVLRHFVGQGRTYIRADDRDPAKIDVEQATANFIAGRVMVSYGLLAELTVEDKYHSGELARLAGDEVRVAARVLGPHWIDAEKIMLFANGVPIREEAIDSGAARDLPDGVKWRGSWVLPRPKHDVHLVAIALGPGVRGPWWKTAKPYQPVSPKWQPQVVACSGAVWLDADGDGQQTSACDYATKLFSESGGDFEKLVALLAGYDRAVTAQAAHLYQSSGKSLLSENAQTAILTGNEETRTGFGNYLKAWRECELARAGE